LSSQVKKEIFNFQICEFQMIIDETFKVIQARYGRRLNVITIEKLVAGIYLTAVKLSSGYSGLASNDLNTLDCCSHNRDRGFGNFTPGNFKGLKVIDLLNLDEKSGFIKTLKLAALNALSAELLTDLKYRIIENLDPIDLIDLTEKKQICVVGAFLSYIKKIAESDSILKIIELNENAIPDEYRRYFVPSEFAEDAVTHSDVVIITGSSLSNHTLDSLLGIIPAKVQVLVVGPTSSLLPDVLFAHGVDITGATRITDNDKMLELVGEGASGFHLFKSCASKICIVNES
jgi:uncharacterized protein (DUF4213/DUF364 family)